jgi:phosphosulfolactate synthase (CoM biosynthesis protein A)
MCRLIESASKRGLKVINEIGVAFAHSEVFEKNIFVERLKQQSKRFIEAGSWKILLESEGLTENIDEKDHRWYIIDKVISPLNLDQFMVEADDQDVLSKYIEIYGPNVNMMIDHTRLLKMEDARIGYGPSQFLWGKVVRY